MSTATQTPPSEATSTVPTAPSGELQHHYESAYAGTVKAQEAMKEYARVYKKAKKADDATTAAVQQILGILDTAQARLRQLPV